MSKAQGYIAALVLVAASSSAMGQSEKASFLVTNEGSGQGANLGGLVGADAHCASLAGAAGINGKT